MVYFRVARSDDGRWAAQALGMGEMDGEDDGITMSAPPAEVPPEGEGHATGNFERWANTDFPMQVFIRGYRDETLDEMLRAEARGSAEFFKGCVKCKIADPLFRCARQSCIGPGMYCEKCIVEQHRQLPTHMIEKLNGEFFRALPQNKLAVEALLQLGHVPELLSNNDGLAAPADRRRAFRAIVRQYRMMTMLKRGGRGHADSGVGGTGQGELVLDCRMCPQPKKNLPEGWSKIDWDRMDEDQRYKCYLLLAEDANFKLINCNVSSEERDPVVDDGAGYFCNRADYAAHIRKHVDGEEMSSWRAFCNMDFIFSSAVLNFALLWLVLSYDIACQFSKNIWTRMEGLPEKYHLQIDRLNVRWIVPNFHLPPHKKGCHSVFSFHWLWGAGCTHGETVKQNWEFLNGAAAATKLMGLGARLTMLEGLLGFHNWRRLVSHRLILKRRMAEAIKEGRAHKTSFDAFHAGLSAALPEAVEEWKMWVEDWEKNRHVENEKNSPYEYTEAATTLKDVRLKLATEEYNHTGDGTKLEREETPSTFLAMGLGIEEAVEISSEGRQLAVDIKAIGPNPTTSQRLEIIKRRTQLRGRIKAFRKQQKTYMPKVRRYLTASQRLVWDRDDKEPEATRLFMPSDLPNAGARVKACAAGLDSVEARLQTGEAGEALDGLRAGLRTRALTRGQGILCQINLKIHGSKLRYRYARQALLKLKGHGAWEEEFKVLTEDDVRALNERALTEEEKASRECLRMAGEVPEEGGIAVLGDVVSGETHRHLSWIWYAVSKKEGEDERLHEALRVEWCKAYSRSRRWREELVLVEEEMRRTIEYGDWARRRWLTWATARTVLLGKSEVMSAEVAEGVRAYALEQADREQRTNEELRVQWGPIRARGGQYLRGESLQGQPEIVVEVDRESMRWAEALAYEREEVENDMYQ
ncbi:hypothetical protein C8F04DRAFT_1264926 [Mycena alexandri]|uniref:CxC2-like cysteine cluster KDZ transposase-associated domain-containing protein n=1 Tax=Mycena alexandri TaxID=1745969 RepID=A0AAD6SND7_9AGAR|nr:hypothetical protein C8F04DRAFT_1264926 [Mycena alexandri]